MDLNFDKDLFDRVVQYYDYMWMKNHGANVQNLFPDLPFRYCYLCITNIYIFYCVGKRGLAFLIQIKSF